MPNNVSSKEKGFRANWHVCVLGFLEAKGVPLNSFFCWGTQPCPTHLLFKGSPNWTLHLSSKTFLFSVWFRDRSPFFNLFPGKSNPFLSRVNPGFVHIFQGGNSMTTFKLDWKKNCVHPLCFHRTLRFRSLGSRERGGVPLRGVPPGPELGMWCNWWWSEAWKRGLV